MVLLKYSRADGSIVAVISSTVPALLEAQRVETDVDYGYTQAVIDLAPTELQERWRIQEDLLVPKTVVMLTATPNPFVADGQSACWITVAPFHPCTVWLGEEDFALTEDDPQLLLTSTQPHTWEVRLQTHAQLWATPIVVEAQ